VSYKNLLSATTLLISLFLAAGSVSASIVLPQESSTAEDGVFSISTDMTLWSDPDNIYNFENFHVGGGATLTIDNTGPVYIYSSQSITIDSTSSLFSLVPDLYLIAPEIFLGSINTTGNLSLVATTLTVDSNSTTGADTGTGAVTISNGGSVIIGDSIIPSGATGTITLAGGSILISDTVLTITPVPVPPALLFFASGFMVLLSRFKKA